MGPPVVVPAGNGSPRPLLDGVYRKACDYCVRSKRGCNGGKPCEQCIRRDHACSYSQRRKSGPRGRPVLEQEQHEKQQAVSTNTTPSGPVRRLGTRASCRRPTMKKGISTSPIVVSKIKVSPTSSPPSLTASTSPSSSSSSPPSESSSDDGEGDPFSDSSSRAVEAAAAEGEQKKQKLQQKQHMHKRSKISRPPGTQVSAPPGSCSAGECNDHPAVSPKLVALNKTETRGGPAPVLAPSSAAAIIAAAAAATAAAVAAATVDLPTPQDEEQLLKLTASLSSSSSSSYSSSSSSLPSPSSSPPLLFLDEAASYISKGRMMLTTGDQTWPPRPYSPLTVGAPLLPLHLQRSSSLPTWAREASIDAQQQQQRQQQQQVHRSSASVGAVPTTVGTINSTITGTNSYISARIGETTMQPMKISSTSPSPPSRSATVTTTTDRPCSMLIHMATQQQQAQAHQAPAFAVKSDGVFSSSQSAQQSLPPSPPSDPMDVAAEQTAATAATILAASTILDAGDFEVAGAAKDLEEDELARCPWQIPSLTREMSLARVVAALGGEQTASSHGVGLEGSSVNVW
ncbi:unnamed protein product [Pylaiella littoralis]